jgi:hypothetical protein
VYDLVAYSTDFSTGHVLLQDTAVFYYGNGYIVCLVGQNDIYVSARGGPFMKANYYGQGGAQPLSITENTIYFTQLYYGIFNLWRTDSTGLNLYFALADISDFAVVDVTNSDNVTTTVAVFANKYVYDSDGNAISWQTVKSVDRGATWSLLTPPADCGPECNLHLAMRSRINFQTSATFPGIIIAVGRTGKYFHEDFQTYNYISRDFGETWELLYPTYKVPGLGFQGNAIQLLDDDISANRTEYTVLWSAKANPQVDDWLPFNLTIVADALYGYFALPNGHTQLITVRQDPDTNMTTTTLTLIDYQQVLALNNVAMCSSDDVISWTSPDCINGANVTIRRKANNVACTKLIRNDDVVDVICTCERDDYECDNGFKLGDNNETCVRNTAITLDETKNCQDGGQYLHSIGYQKIYGNKCATGVVLNPVPEKCPKRDSSNAGVIAGAVVGSIVGVCLIAIIVVVVKKRRASAGNKGVMLQD